MFKLNVLLSQRGSQSLGGDCGEVCTKFFRHRRRRASRLAQLHHRTRKPALDAAREVKLAARQATSRLQNPLGTRQR